MGAYWAMLNREIRGLVILREILFRGKASKDADFFVGSPSLGSSFFVLRGQNPFTWGWSHQAIDRERRQAVVAFV